MQKVVLLTPGKIKADWLCDGCKHFAERIKHSIDFAIIELPASHHPDPEKYREEEGEKILQRLEKLEGDVWLLDERGKMLTSTQFASALEKAKDNGRTIIFILGGAYGVSDAVRDKAEHLLQLSAMTFPHELCRLIFLEQLYRATEIMKGSGYHH